MITSNHSCWQMPGSPILSALINITFICPQIPHPMVNTAKSMDMTKTPLNVQLQKLDNLLYSVKHLEKPLDTIIQSLSVFSNHIFTWLSSSHQQPTKDPQNLDHCIHCPWPQPLTPATSFEPIPVSAKWYQASTLLTDHALGENFQPP